MHAGEISKHYRNTDKRGRKKREREKVRGDGTWFPSEKKNPDWDSDVVPGASWTEEFVEVKRCVATDWTGCSL